MAWAVIHCLHVGTGPFGVEDPSALRDCFPDLVVPFKQHFIFEPDRALRAAVSPHHRYYAERALRENAVQTERLLKGLPRHRELLRKIAEHGMQAV